MRERKTKDQIVLHSNYTINELGEGVREGKRKRKNAMCWQ